MVVEELCARKKHLVLQGQVRGAVLLLVASPHRDAPSRSGRRLSVPRGPCTMPILREAWSKGLIDEKTLVWGTGLMDWLPMRNITLLVAAVRTPEGEPTNHRSRSAREKRRIQSRAHVAPLLKKESPLSARAVQLATWLKKKLVFERRLGEIRKERASVRGFQSNQLDQWN